MRAASASSWLRIAPAVFIMGWGGNHFTPLLHLYQQIGQYSVLVVDLFLGTYVLGLVPGLLVASTLSDRHGRKPVTTAGLVLGIGASLILATCFQSPELMCAGRMLAGISVGIGMSVGTSWIKELSSPPYDAAAGAAAGARRPALALTLGFGLGAGASGALAQWGPWPTALPYALHIALSLVALALLPRATETVRPHRQHGRLLQDLRVPLAGHRRFVRVILPAAPWIFGTSGIAYAVVPMLEQPRVGDMQLGYATLLTVVTLGTGAVVQPFAARLNRATKGRALLVGLGLIVLALAAAAVNAVYLSPLAGVLAAVVLGAAFGICMVSGLAEIQRLAAGPDLAGLTGVYYSVAYLGFLLPVLLAGLARFAGYPVLLTGLAAVCLASVVLVAAGLRTTARPADRA